MARLIDTPTGGGLVGSFERLVLDTLLQNLPNTFGVAPNFQIKPRERDALEYDFTILAPHAMFVVEAKEWYGRLTGDDAEWLLNQTPKKPPLWLVNTKCKVLKGELGALGGQVPVVPLLVVPDGTKNHLGGSWASHVRSLTGLVQYLLDPSKVSRQTDIRGYHDPIVQILQGKWGARRRGQRRRVGGYEITETLYADASTGEYLARRALIEGDPARYRIRTWRLDRSRSDDAVAKQRAVICRPTEAVSRIGPHPNLLRVLQFEFVDDDSEFFEVTEWSEFGTLHGFVANQERGRLTLRERLEIAEGVAAALEAVHAHDVVHRNVSPETIVVGFDRRPRLTDFDRAYLDSKVTVFAATEARRHDPAYVPPELADATDYDFDTASDMYSFGVLLYVLLTEEKPFAGPNEAKAAGGVPPAWPSQKREGIDPKLDALVRDLLRVDDFKARPAATASLDVLRCVLGMTTGAVPNVDRTSTKPKVRAFDDGSVLEGGWRVDAKLGAGAFSRVFKVFNFDHQKTYAMKVIDDAENVDLLLHEFNAIAAHLPQHPNIAKIIWCGRLAPENIPYLVTEFVDGETLEPYCDGRKKLAWTDVKRIGIELLDALAAIHPDKAEYERIRAIGQQRSLTDAEADALFAAQERATQGILHRDIKPANILLEMPTHRPKLIDFNIAARASEAKGQAGTPRYWAPDRGVPEWRPDADLFSLGVVLYELILQRHPYADDRPGNGTPYDPRDLAPGISDELAAFLLRAVQPAGGDRFPSARAMRVALEAVDTAIAPAPPPSLPPGLFPGISVSAEEAKRSNYNPYVTRLLTLYSQARRTNSGTRGLDEIGRMTYVETRLDQKLAPAIASGLFRLVIVTGNAGDGKTAFLQSVEALFQRRGAMVERLPTQNGSRWTFEGARYETNYDGSQDEGDRESDDVLAAFLDPFAGPSLPREGGDVRLLAINEGRLLDFLAHSRHGSRFGGLHDFVHEALAGALAVEPTAVGGTARALLVNLNLRAVAAGGAESLVERQLRALLRPELWAPCAACTHARRCPIKHNVDTLADPASGAATRQRIRRLFEIVHLRRRAHVTMRDLRSALAWMLLRDHSCDDVAALLGRTDTQVTDDLADLYYPNAFAAVDDSATKPDHQQPTDRLVQRLREADVGLLNAPLLDRRLDRDPISAVPWMTFETRSPDALTVMRATTIGTPDVGTDVPLPVLLERRRLLLSNWRRWAYFERRDEGWQAMLPYRSVDLLDQVIEAQSDADRAQACVKLRDGVLDAISLSEGITSPAIRRRWLGLKITRVRRAAVQSYRLFPKTSFRVEAAAPRLGDYLEQAPDAVELIATGGAGAARLRISLDLLEMLELIRSGYRPTTADLEGLFINLLIFRNELLTSTFSRVLVTADDSDFYEIAAEGGPDGIRLRLERHTEEGST